VAAIRREEMAVEAAAGAGADSDSEEIDVGVESCGLWFKMLGFTSDEV
jgi:hypothetical protein